MAIARGEYWTKFGNIFIYASAVAVSHAYHSEFSANHIRANGTESLFHSVHLFPITQRCLYRTCVFALSSIPFQSTILNFENKRAWFRRNVAATAIREHLERHRYGEARQYTPEFMVCVAIRSAHTCISGLALNGSKDTTVQGTLNIILCTKALQSYVSPHLLVP